MGQFNREEQHNHRGEAGQGRKEKTIKVYLRHWSGTIRTITLGENYEITDQRTKIKYVIHIPIKIVRKLASYSRPWEKELLFRNWSPTHEGTFGERIARYFYEHQLDYEILDKDDYGFKYEKYRPDIITKDSKGVIHVVEVKSVYSSKQRNQSFAGLNANIAREAIGQLDRYCKIILKINPNARLKKDIVAMELRRDTRGVKQSFIDVVPRHIGLYLIKQIKSEEVETD